MLPLDALIVGHGLAGAVLAHVLHRAGWRVLVLDRPDPAAASRVAAGLVNPLAGRRFALSWRAQELLPAAAAFYQSVEAELGIRSWHPLPVLKFFATPEEANTGAGKADGSVPFVEELLPPLTTGPVYAPLGGLRLSGGGFLQTEVFLDALVAERRRQGQFVSEPFAYDRLHLSSESLGRTTEALSKLAGPRELSSTTPTPPRREPGVVASYSLSDGSTVQARRVIFCEGAAVVQNPWFGSLPFTPNTGEVLDLTLPTPAEGGPADDVVYNGGVYVVPHGGGRFRVGATYDWRPTPPEPTAAGRADLLQRLARHLPGPVAAVRDHRAARRPAVRDRRPLVGFHPTHPALVLFNGFGSKGVGLAPGLAAHLLAVLRGEATLWPEIDLARYAIGPPR